MFSTFGKIWLLSVSRSHRTIEASNFFLSPKKIAERFFSASTVRFFFIAQDDRGVNFFFTPKKSRSDFFWRRPLGCVLKETYAEGGKKRLVTCVDKKTYAEGGKKRINETRLGPGTKNETPPGRNPTSKTAGL